MQKLEYVLRRMVTSVLVLLGVTIITFTLSRVVPSNPAAMYIGPKARPADIARVTKELGLDKPLAIQYLTYMKSLTHGDLGISIGSKRPVLQEITSRLPASLELLFVAMFFAVLIGIPMGVISASLQGKWPDIFVRSSSIIGVSMPAFWLGLILQIVFFRYLGWFPLSGRIGSDIRFTAPIEHITGFYLFDSFATGNWVAFKGAAMHLALPALTLAAYPIGLIARMTRGSMLEVLEQDYIRTAKAYGLSKTKVTYVYALKNAIGPALTVVGLTFAFALTGAFFVEVVFNWPGLGQFTVRALLNVDYPAIMGVTLLGAIGYVSINLLVDLVQAWIDPRISLH